jgi:adenylate kinase family enzyme
MVDRIHILGASGSGITTLGRAIAQQFDYVHLDTDDFFWQPTQPPYQRPRDRDTRQRLLGTVLAQQPRWALSGSLCGWGDIFIPQFELVVFLWVPCDIRLARLQVRERERYGAATLAPGGAQHESYEAFLQWAAAYDDGAEDMRSRRLHEGWLAALPCHSIRLEGVCTIEEQITRFKEEIVKKPAGNA